MARDPKLGAALSRALSVVYNQVAESFIENIDRIRKCEQCGKDYFCVRSDQKCCGAECRRKRAASGEEFKKKRAEYMRDRRKGEVDQLVKLAAEFPDARPGKELAKNLNARLAQAQRRGEKQTHADITVNWLTRHWKAIERERRKQHGKH